MPPSRAPSRIRCLPSEPRRIATLSLHTSPLALPGTGDAGGMNVYVVELAKQLAAAGVESDIFTRATSRQLAPAVELVPGVTVRHVRAGPYDGLGKEELPEQLCAFATGVLRAEAARDPGHYDLLHSHYWLSGQVGWLAAERWGVPLVHSMHTMARVKNAQLAAGDRPEPAAREVGEQQVVDAADRLVASTPAEAAELVGLYGADPRRVATIAPGVDLAAYRPGDAALARHRLGLPGDAVVLLFVGRIQPLKAPDLLLRAAARLVAADPGLRARLVVAVVGGPSGTGLDDPRHLPQLASTLGIADRVRFQPPVAPGRLADWYRAATVCVVPSRSESFGLVALEAQACGTPVVAAAVVGLRTVVRDGVTGLLVGTPEPEAYAYAIGRLLDAPGLRRSLGRSGVAHAAGFSWAATGEAVLQTYREAMSARRPVLAAAQ